MARRHFLLLALALTPTLLSQTGSGDAVLASGTPMAVVIDRHLPMKIGTPVRARLLYPVYAKDTLLLPADAVVLGSITALRPDRSRRIHARLNADFTPFHLPTVRFTQIVAADGSLLSLVSEDATNGAPVFRIVAPPPTQGGFFHRHFQQGKQLVRDRLAVVTAPEKKDRLLQLAYQQLPYHPERVEKGTAWTMESAAPVRLAHLPPNSPPPATATVPAPWLVQANLNGALTSATSKAGQTVQATVAEPIYNPDGSVAVPQGAILLGAVTKSKPARRFGRAGTLNFSFRQLVQTDGTTQSVQASLQAADSTRGADLAMTSEGEVHPKPQDKILVPLILAFLATRPLDRDGGEHMLGKDAVASNSLGLIGFIVGIATRQANVATGIGAYGAALSLYQRWFAHGKEVTFARDTRIVVQTTARRSEAIKPTAAP